MAGQLARDNDFVTDLDRRFADLVREKRIPRLDGIDALENKFIIPGVFWNTTHVSAADSASYFGAYRIIPNTDHFSIAKPTSIEHPSHQLLWEFFDTRFKALILPQKSQVNNTSTSPPRPPTTFKSQFRFGHSEFNLSASPQLKYGFTSVETDKTVTGQGVRIQRLRVDMMVHTHKGYPCCDVHILFGAGPFGFQSGPVFTGQNPFYVNPSTLAAPAQVHFVVGNNAVAYAPESDATLYATYDLDSGQFGGNIDRSVAAFSPLLNLPNGLYSQIFLWNGNPNVDIDLKSIALTVEGTKP